MEKEKNNIHLCPKLTLTGLVLVGEVWSLPLWLGPSSCPLHSLPSEVKELCLLVGSSLLSCNERSQQENKALFFQSSGSDVSTDLRKIPPFLRMTEDNYNSGRVLVVVLFNILIRQTLYFSYN